MKKIIKIIFFIIIAAGAIGAWYYSSSQPLAVDMLTLIPREAHLWFVEPGIAVPQEKVSVFSEAAGLVSQLNVEEGQTVSQGEIILIIDSSEYLQNKLTLEANIKNFEAQRKALSFSQPGRDEQIQLQQLVVDQRRHELDIANTELERAEALYELDIIPLDELTNARRTVQTAQNILAQAEQQLAVISVDTTDEAYKRAMDEYYLSMIREHKESIALIDKRIENCIITAPISGNITSLSAEKSSFLNQGSPVAVITQSDSILIEAYVATRDAAEIALSQQVGLIQKLRSGNIEFTGIISDIASSAEIKLSALGVEERRLKVKITPINPPPLFDGLSLDVRFTLYREADRIIIPKTAVFTKNDTDYVFIVIDDKAVETPVVTGTELSSEYVIVSGLSADNTIITDCSITGLKQDIPVTAK